MDGILNTKTLISFSRIVLKIDMYIARPLFPSKQIVSRRPAKIVKTAWKPNKRSPLPSSISKWAFLTASELFVKKSVYRIFYHKLNSFGKMHKT